MICDDKLSDWLSIDLSYELERNGVAKRGDYYFTMETIENNIRWTAKLNDEELLLSQSSDPKSVYWNRRTRMYKLYDTDGKLTDSSMSLWMLGNKYPTTTSTISSYHYPPTSSTTSLYQYPNVNQSYLA